MRGSSCACLFIYFLSLLIPGHATTGHRPRRTKTHHPSDQHHISPVQFVDLPRLIRISSRFSSFAHCRQTVTDYLRNGNGSSCFLPLTVWSDVAQNLQRAIDLTLELEIEDSLALAETTVDVIETEHNVTEDGNRSMCIGREDTRAVLSELRTQDFFLEWNLWRSLCSCEGSRQLNRTEQVFLSRYGSSEKQPLHQTLPTACLNLSTNIINHINSTWTTLATLCQNCTTHHDNVTSTCWNLHNCTTLVENLLCDLHIEQQLAYLLSNLRHDLSKVKIFAAGIQPALHQEPYVYQDFREQAANIVCYIAFNDSLIERQTLPPLDTNQLRLCPEHCNDLSQILGAIDKISVSSHMPGSLTFLRYTANTHCARYSKSATQCAVIDNGEVYVQNRTNNSTNLMGKFCTNLVCHHPTIQTLKPDHAWEMLADALMHLEEVWSHVIGSNRSTTTNSPFLSCGKKCMEIGYHENDLYTARIVLSMFGYGAIAMEIIAIVTFILNRHRIQAPARRVIVCLNVVFLLFSLDYLAMPIKGWAHGWSSPCHDDGTLRLKSPTTFDACAANAARNIFASYLSLWLGVAAAHAWYRLIGMLCSLDHARNKAQDQRLERLYFFGSAAISVVMTIVAMTQARIVGVPLTGSCFPHRTDWFYWYVPMFALGIFLGLTCLGRGLPRLFKLEVHSRRSSLKRGKVSSSRLRGSGLSSVSVSPDTTSGLRRLFKLVTVYEVCISIHAVSFLSVQCYTFFSDSVKKAEQDIYRHVACRMVSCDPSDCPALPSYSIWPLVIYQSYTLVMSMVLCTWAFRRVYWQRYLPAAIFKQRKRTFSPSASFASLKSRLSVDSVFSSASVSSAETETFRKIARRRQSLDSIDEL